MKKKIYLLFFIQSNFCRIFFDQNDLRLFLYNSIKMPLESYKESRGNTYHTIIGSSFQNNFASYCFLNNSPETVDLSGLFHGSNTFNLSDVNNLPDGLSNDYQINPGYSFSQSQCNIYFHINKDFNYKNQYDIHTYCTLSVPFISQKIINHNSGSMYFASEQKIDPSKNIDSIQNKIDSATRAAYEFATQELKIENRFDTIYQGKDRFQLKEENGKKVFAVRADYLLDNPNTIASFESITNPNKYIAFNRHIQSDKYKDIEDNQIDIEKVLSGYCLASETENDRLPMKCQPITKRGTDEETIIIGTNKLPVVYGNPFSLPLASGAASLIPYEYGTASKNELIVNDEISYSLLTKPDFVRDINYGDHIVLNNNFFYGDCFSNDRFSQNSIETNSLIRIVATGNFPSYTKSSVSFLNPPVAVQISPSDTFPQTFGVQCPINNHDYKETVLTNYEQFDIYNPGNEVGILNEDGTINNNNKKKAILWYENDYLKLFQESNRSKLETLYITSCLDSSNNLTQESEIMYSKFNDTPSDLETRVKNLETVVLTPGIEYKSIPFKTPVVEVVDMFGETVFNYFPNILNILNEDTVLNSAIQGNSDTRKSATRNKKHIKNIKNTRLIKQEKKYLEVNQIQMQYDQFHNDGIGDIKIEFGCGSFFLENKMLANIIIGLELPTSNNRENNKKGGSYLALPIGSGGHYIGKLGIQSMYENRDFLPIKITGGLFFDHAFNAQEYMCPAAKNFKIFNFLPVVVPCTINWNSINGFIYSSFYATDFSGCTLGYKFWQKYKDNIKVDYNYYVNLDNQIYSTDLSIDPIKNLSERISHTLIFSIFSELANDITWSCSYARVISGKNIPQMNSFDMTIGLYF